MSEQGLPLTAGKQTCAFDGRKLTPCWALDTLALDNITAGQRPKGLRAVEVLIRSDEGPQRVTLIGVCYARRSGDPLKNCVMLNRCPWCGEDISPRDKAGEGPAPTKAA